MSAQLRPLHRVVLPLILVLAVAACRREAPPPGMVARVGGSLISLEQLDRYLRVNGGSSVHETNAAAASALLDQLIEETALVPAASDPEESPDQAARENRRRAAALAEIAASVPPPTDEEIETYFRRHASEYASTERRRVRQILVREEELAGRIVAEIRGGVAFEEAARRYSRAPNAARGGEVGWVERRQLPRLFEDAIFRLPQGGMTGVIPTDSNFYHLFQVDEISPAGEPSLGQLRPIIEEKLREEAIRRRIDQRVEELARQGDIRVWPERLPFRYTGRWASGE